MNEHIFFCFFLSIKTSLTEFPTNPCYVDNEACDTNEDNLITSITDVTSLEDCRAHCYAATVNLSANSSLIMDQRASLSATFASFFPHVRTLFSVMIVIQRTHSVSGNSIGLDIHFDFRKYYQELWRPC